MPIKLRKKRRYTPAVSAAKPGDNATDASQDTEPLSSDMELLPPPILERSDCPALKKNKKFRQVPPSPKSPSILNAQSCAC